MVSIKRFLVKLPLLFAASAILAALFTTCAPRKESFTQYIFGTYITITLYDDINMDVINEVFLRNRKIQNTMSISPGYEDSELMQLNSLSAGETQQLSSETATLLKRALEYSELSNGAFDPTIYPLVALWDIQGEAPRLPEESDIAKAQSLVDYRKLRIAEAENGGARGSSGENNTGTVVYFEEDGMGVDLGGIAKGYASMEARDIFRKHGISKGILDFGGNIYLIGLRSDTESWRVGVRDPLGAPNDYLGVLEGIHDVSIISSGGYERFFVQDNIRYHHILDPATGYPAESDLLSVTIVGADAVAADALSTACFVLGREKAYKLIAEQEGLDAVFVTKEKQIYLTPGIRPFFLLANMDYRVVEQQ